MPDLDLARHYGDVVKITMHCYGRKIRRMQYDPDDVLQYIFLGLLRRQRGRSRYDPERGGLFAYIKMTAGCLLANYSRWQRRVQRDVVGLPGYDDATDTYGLLDVATVAAALPDQRPSPEAVVDRDQRCRRLTHRARRRWGAKAERYVLLRLRDGLSSREAARRVPIDPTPVEAMLQAAAA